MMTGGGHEPYHFPEAQRPPEFSEPPKKRTISTVAGMGCTIAAVLWIISLAITDLRFFGDTRPPTPDELVRSRRFFWGACGVLVGTVLTSIGVARLARVGVLEWIARFLLGAVIGPGSAILVVMTLLR
jgi:hypothetical protein